MASVFPTGNYYTKSGSLGVNTVITAYTCGEQGEEFADVTGITVAASTANADTCTVARLQNSDAATYTLVFKGPVEADFPLQIEGLPIHLTKGDAIKLTATAGATNALHYHISINKITRSTGAK